MLSSLFPLKLSSVSSVQVAGGPDRRTEKGRRTVFHAVNCFHLLLPFPQPCRVRDSITYWASAGLPGRPQSAFHSWRNISASNVEILQETQCLPLPMNEHEIQIPFFFSSESRVLEPNPAQFMSQNKVQKQFWDADAQMMHCKVLPGSASGKACTKQAGHRQAPPECLLCLRNVS